MSLQLQLDLCKAMQSGDDLFVMKTLKTDSRVDDTARENALTLAFNYHRYALVHHLLDDPRITAEMRQRFFEKAIRMSQIHSLHTKEFEAGDKVILSRLVADPAVDPKRETLKFTYTVAKTDGQQQEGQSQSQAQAQPQSGLYWSC